MTGGTKVDIEMKSLEMMQPEDEGRLLLWRVWTEVDVFDIENIISELVAILCLNNRLNEDSGDLSAKDVEFYH